MTVRSVYASTEPGVQAGRIDTLRALCARAEFFLVMFALACGGTSRAPAGLPAPTTPAPVPVAPPAAGPARWRIAAPTAPADFIIEARAVVTARADSLSRSDTVTTRTELRVTPRGAAIDVNVGSYAVQSAGVPARTMPSPVRAVGRFDANGAIVFDMPASGICGSISAAALEATRELWVRWPADAGIGDRWRDSASVTICRDDVPLRLSLVREFRVVSFDGDSSARTITIDRRSSISVSGRGPIRGDTTVVTGTGTASATLRVSTIGGWISEGDGTSELRLTARGATRTQEVQQQVSLSIRRAAGGNR